MATATVSRAEKLAAAARAENYRTCQAALTTLIGGLAPLEVLRLGRRRPDAKREPDYTRGDNPRRNVHTRFDQFGPDTVAWEAEYEPEEDCKVLLLVERRPGGTWVPARKPFAAVVAGRLTAHAALADALLAAGV